MSEATSSKTSSLPNQKSVHHQTSVGDAHEKRTEFYKPESTSQQDQITTSQSSTSKACLLM